MSHREEPSILDRLQVGGLHPDLVAEFRDRHRRRTPCQCSACARRVAEPDALAPTPIQQLALLRDDES